MPKPKKLETNIIENFMKTNDSPPWFRALSDRQMLCALDLLNCIRDDSQQGTTHRVKSLLELIGITPLIKSSGIKIAMRMSQGNDLAFLWFLLELFYTENSTEMMNESYKYSINQQLLISTIAHLDMVTTLRELDRILPMQGQKNSKNSVKSPTPTNLPKGCKKNEEYLSVYLQPLVRPKPILNRYCPSIGYQKVRISPYDNYADPNLIVPNEASRWYANPNLDFGLQGRISSINIVQKILNEEIQNIIIRENTNINTDKIMCKDHKQMEQMKKSLINQLIVATRDKCIAFFSDNSKKKRLRDRFNEQLEINLAKASQEFQEVAQRYETQTWLRLLVYELIEKNIQLSDVLLSKKLDEFGLIDAEMLTEEEEAAHYRQEIESIQKDVEKKSRLEFGHHGKPKRNKLFFHAPKPNAPFKFDHLKIFNVNDLADVNDPKEWIRQSIEDALDMENYINEDEAIGGWLEKTWVEEVKLWNEKLRKRKLSKRKHYGGGDCGPFVDDCDDIMDDQITEAQELKCIPNKLKYINPRDSKLMENMLKNALNEMSKNPKFVFASMPQSHKMPVLKQWIRAKYGLIYTQKERKKALTQTVLILDELRKAPRTLKKPKYLDVSPCNFASYNQHNYILCKTRELVRNYFLKLKVQMLEDVNIYWAALEPYHCPRGPPREIFYAYMPSKEQDIIPFKPWLQYEFMDAKKAHDARKRKNCKPAL